MSDNQAPKSENQAASKTGNGQLPKWTDSQGQEVEAVRITRMTEVEKDQFRIEHDEPHCEPIQVGREFVQRAGGMQQDGFYVRGGDQGERWVSAAHFHGATRQHMDYDETPEKGFVKKEAQAAHGPALNQPNAQPSPADLAAEAQKRIQQSGHDDPRLTPAIEPAAVHAAQAAQTARAAQAATKADLPTSHALEEAPHRRAHR